MRAAIFLVLIATGCSPRATAPSRALLTCARTCPVGDRIEPVTPQAEHVLTDCCVDPNGDTWSSCAWNGTGRHVRYAFVHLDQP